MNAQFDLTGDSLVNLPDRDAWLVLALAELKSGLATPYRLGDANLDGFVNGQNFQLWNANNFMASDHAQSAASQPSRDDENQESVPDWLVQ